MSDPATPNPGPTHLHWGAEALWQALNPLLPDVSVEVLARTDSTNSQLVERARRHSGLRDAPISRPGEFESGFGITRTPHGRRSGDTRATLLVAEQQSRGRGRQGRTWYGSVGASLTFSLSLPLAPQSWNGLSLAVGLALANALDPPQPNQSPRLGLKWPNDLWLWEGPSRGRKLGGILIETVSVGSRRMCIVGIGLNVLQQHVPEASQGYACLAELLPNATAPTVLACVAKPLAQALLHFEAEGFAPLQADYRRRDVLLGQTVVGSEGSVQGLALGVNAEGAMKLQEGDGAERLVHSGEVSLRPVPSGSADS